MSRYAHLTSQPKRGYAGTALAKSSVGLGRLISLAQLPRILAVFLRKLFSYLLFMVSCAGTPSGVLEPRDQSTNPSQFTTLSLVASGGEFKAHSLGDDHV